MGGSKSDGSKSVIGNDKTLRGLQRWKRPVLNPSRLRTCGPGVKAMSIAVVDHQLVPYPTIPYEPLIRKDDLEDVSATMLPRRTIR